MSGLRKAKEYDWKDTNLALFGSDVEKNIKKAAAGTEKAWANAGENVGLQIWRIVKFKVTHWPKSDYGNFFDGDSYIVLNTYKENDEIKYDVHFWIGRHSTEDEYCTAAYKTVELDTYLDDKPIQHREVSSHESKLFMSYFPTFSTMKGGADTGFRRREPEKYTPRLLWVHGTTINNAKIEEIEYKRGNVNENDVFILDMGEHIYQINGTKCDKDEKHKALMHVQTLKAERGGKVTTHSHDYDGVSSRPPLDKLPPGTADKGAPQESTAEPVLIKLSDASGHLEKEVVARGRISKSALNSNDVFIFDTGKHCFVWVGGKASIDERRKSMPYAHHHLMETDHPLVPVTVCMEGKEPKNFNDAF